jgi:hypothetical protein
MFLRYRPPPYLSFPIEIKRVDPPTPVSKRSVSSDLPDDVLSPGDLVGEGYTIQGEFIVPISRPSHSPHSPLQEFEVVKTIETGTYAVVYLVREVLSRPIPSVEGLLLLMGSMDIDADPDPAVSVEYGRHYVIKCLSKADLDDDTRAAQLAEVSPVSNPGHFLTVIRSQRTNPSNHTPTSSPSTGPSNPAPSSSSYSNTYQVKTCSTSFNNPRSTHPHPRTHPRPRRHLSSPPHTQRKSSPAPASASSRPCSAKCATRSPRAMITACSIGISNRRILS